MGEGNISIDVTSLSGTTYRQLMLARLQERDYLFVKRHHCSQGEWSMGGPVSWSVPPLNLRPQRSLLVTGLSTWKWFPMCNSSRALFHISSNLSKLAIQDLQSIWYWYKLSPFPLTLLARCPSVVFRSFDLIEASDFHSLEVW